MEGLYLILREIVSDKFKIKMIDGKDPVVIIVPDSLEGHPWTSFRGESVEDALMRAVNKIRNPGDDYRAIPTCLDSEGMLWKASERSVYGEDHIRLFLRE